MTRTTQSDSERTGKRWGQGKDDGAAVVMVGAKKRKDKEKPDKNIMVDMASSSFMLTDSERVGRVDCSLANDGRRNVKDLESLISDVQWAMRSHLKTRCFIIYVAGFRKLPEEESFIELIMTNSIPLVFNFAAQHFEGQIIQLDSKVSGCWVSA